MNLHDTHAHLLFPVLFDRLPEVLENARSADVRRITVPALGPGTEELTRALSLARTMPGITVIAGVHPHQAVRATPGFCDEILAYREHLAGWGEIGLDFHYDFSPREVQADIFAQQLDAAWQTRLPVILHIREAHREALSMVQEHPVRENSVVHCFTGDAETARKWLDLGFFISFSGIATFPKALEVRHAVRMVPQDRLLVETDAPYLAPQRRRGRPCEPAFVRETFLELAALRGEDPEVLAAALWENGQKVFACDGCL